MKFATIFRILGLLLMIFSLSMLPPVLVDLSFNESVWIPFAIAFFTTFLTGIVLWFPFRHLHHEFKTRDGFLIVVLFWSVLCLFGALPFMLTENPNMAFTDAVFEAVSGLTTTGASVLKGLDALPHAIRYYRQQLHMLGGMGIIVLAVAILPMLGVGGMQLYRAEAPGPLKDVKLTPRIAQTAKSLWYIYLSLIIICAFSYWIFGMTPFDAIGESFSTVATGGFSMHDGSFAYYHNPKIEIVGIVFMILSGTNFALHFLAIRNRSFRHYWHDIEFRTFLFIIVSVSTLVSLVLF